MKYLQTRGQLDIEKVISKWDNRYWISQYGDEYKLIIYYRLYQPTHIKYYITANAATKLISELNLIPVKDTLFKRATSWKAKEFVELEIERLKNILHEKENEVQFIQKEIINLMASKRPQN